MPGKQVIRIPLQRRHYSVTATGQAAVEGMDGSYKRQWVFGENDRYMCMLRDDGTWDHLAQSSVLRPESLAAAGVPHETIVCGENDQVGINCTPKTTWIANAYALEFDRGAGVYEAAVVGYNGSMYSVQNLIYDATNARWEYGANSFANSMFLTASSGGFVSFPTGVAGNIADYTANTTNRFDVSEPLGTIINATLGDFDTYIMYNGAVAAFFVEGSSGQIGLGIVAPSTNLHIYENAASTTPQILIEQANNAGDAAMVFTTAFRSFTVGIDRVGDPLDIFKISPVAAFDGNYHFCMNATGDIGIGTYSPQSLLEIRDADAHPVLTISAQHATDYDPQIQFHTDTPLAVKFTLGVDGSNDFFKIFSGEGVGGTTEFVIDTGGQVGIGAEPSSAALEIASTTGALRVPRMTTAEKNALTAVNGDIVYDSTLNKFQGYEGGAWASFI